MNSFFNLAYICGRLVSIILSFKLHLLIMIGFCLTTASVSIIMLGLFAGPSQEMITWIFVVALGAGYSANYPTLFAYIDSRVPVTDSVGGIIMGLSGLILAIDPLIVGLTLDTNSNSFIYVIASNMFITLTSLIVQEISLYLMFRRRRHVDGRDKVAPLETSSSSPSPSTISQP